MKRRTCHKWLTSPQKLFVSAAIARSLSPRRFDHLANLPSQTTFRTARASSRVFLPDEVMVRLREGDISTKKGPVFATAIIAGTMAAKKTPDLIPFCHSIPLEKCKIDITVDPEARNDIVVQAEVSSSYKTGVEMEALTACSVASLTIYDMCKALSHDIVIMDTRLLQKSGGKSDFNV